MLMRISIYFKREDNVLSLVLIHIFLVLIIARYTVLELDFLPKNDFRYLAFF